MLAGVHSKPGRKYNGVLSVDGETLRFTPPKVTQYAHEISFAISHVEAGFVLQENGAGGSWTLHFHLDADVEIGKLRTTEVQFCLVMNKSPAKNKETKQQIQSFMTEVEECLQKVHGNDSFRIREVTATKIRGIQGTAHTELHKTHDYLLCIREKPFFVYKYQDINSIILERLTNYSPYCDVSILPKNLKTHHVITSVPKSEACEFVQWARYAK